MSLRLLVVGAAIGAIGAGAASAHTRHHHLGGRGYAAPAHPVPYAQLNRYLGAQEVDRASFSATSATEADAAIDAAAADSDRNWAAAPPGDIPQSVSSPGTSIAPPNGSQPRPY